VASSTPAPAEAYAAARSRAARPELTAFTADLPFELDGFQRSACAALEDGHGVLVCAPTGAGKTVVGEFAVHLALARGQKCFYTTPIKALSNQKYADLVARHGADAVGLLTGDTAVNGDAQVVVMTTEVLRNMIYAGSRHLEHLGYVVMDEVHYLADRFRGAVWEEVILQLPEHVALVSLSATVSNAEEFGDWLVTVRGDTTVVVDEHRPVPLWQHMMVGHRLLDLFAGEDESGELQIDADLVRHTRDLERQGAVWDRGRGRGGTAGRAATAAPASGSGPRRGPRDRPAGPQRAAAAITVVFSRAGCDAAVGQCVRSGLRLTTEDEAVEIRRTVERAPPTCRTPTWPVLGYWEWLDALERGIAAHHAGMLPRSRRPSRSCSSAAWSARCSPPRPSALGINMPARTVVLERLVKYNGESHADLTPGEYTQLTGRAGRRGIDVEGHAVVVWQPGVDPVQVAGLASTRTYPLRSSFRPGYNMAVNLVGRLGTGAARELLEQSLGQFQADRSVVGISRRIERNTEALAGYADSMRCHLGDFAEYAACAAGSPSGRRRSRARGSRSGATPRPPRCGRCAPATSSRCPAGAAPAWPWCSTPAWAGTARTPARWCSPRTGGPGGCRARTSPRPSRRWGGCGCPSASTTARPPCGGTWPPRCAVPASWRPHHRGGAAATPATTPSWGRCAARCGRTPATAATTGRPTPAGRSATRAWSGRPSSCGRSAPPPRTRWRGRSTGSGPCSASAATSRRHRHRARERLARLWGESDLLTAECLRQGLWDGLEPAELAAVVSALVYESRRVEGPVPRVPSGAVSEALTATVRAWSELEADERRHRVDRTREPDAGFAWPMHRWARGESLAAVLTAAEQNGSELSAGDFVRWCRQVLDLLDQIAGVAGRGSAVGRTAVRAGQAVRRGVVAVGAT
jgi:ATP-dependent RNA helicase HelY